MSEKRITQVAINEFLRSNPGSTVDEVAAGIGFSKWGVQQKLTSMEFDGRLYRLTDSAVSKSYWWTSANHLIRRALVSNVWDGRLQL